MNEAYLLAPACAAGGLLGVFYFWGLWITVRRLPYTGHKGLMLIGSFLLRGAAVLSGFLLVMDGSGLRLAAALLGFLAVRQVMSWRIKGRTEVARGEG